MDITPPYLLFLATVPDAASAKTAFGIRDWRPEWTAAQWRLPGCQVDLGVPDRTPADAAARGARTLVIGTVSAGGHLPEAWFPHLIEAMDAGLDIASGMHARLTGVPELVVAAERTGRRLIDVRDPGRTFATGNGRRRSGRRVLTIGTDCIVGKKYTALALERALRARGTKATFRATGQTGIFIAGGGVPMDAVVSDFLAGAAEWLTPDNDPDHWDVVEGQGSLFHPSFAGVTLGLLHGTQPDAFVLCHEPTRTTMRHVTHPIPGIEDVIELTIRHGRLTNPAIRCAGLSFNTAALDEAAARATLAEAEARFGLPACDPVRFGIEPVAEALLSMDI